jgi:hypothetical protein
VSIDKAGSAFTRWVGSVSAAGVATVAAAAVVAVAAVGSPTPTTTSNVSHGQEVIAGANILVLVVFFVVTCVEVFTVPDANMPMVRHCCGFVQSLFVIKDVDFNGLLVTSDVIMFDVIIDSLLIMSDVTINASSLFLTSSLIVT